MGQIPSPLVTGRTQELQLFGSTQKLFQVESDTLKDFPSIK